MTAPRVVKVVARARLNPLQGRVRRIVALSDGSDRMERWDFHQGAWVTCPYASCANLEGFILSEADCRRLGIPPEGRDGTARGGA
jgi:hypothetical protein